MSDRAFRILMLTVMVVGVLCTAALMLYTIHLYKNVSILQFIANERY